MVGKHLLRLENRSKKVILLAKTPPFHLVEEDLPHLLRAVTAYVSFYQVRQLLYVKDN